MNRNIRVLENVRVLGLTNIIKINIKCFIHTNKCLLITDVLNKTDILDLTHVFDIKILNSDLAACDIILAIADTEPSRAFYIRLGLRRPPAVELFRLDNL
jgi:hypothetical protein